jgi:hypothetical protein
MAYNETPTKGEAMNTILKNVAIVAGSYVLGLAASYVTLKVMDKMAENEIDKVMTTQLFEEPIKETQS